MKPLFRFVGLFAPLALSACAVAPSYDDLGGYGGYERYGGSPVYAPYPAYEYAPAPVYVGPSFFYSSGRPYPARPYRRDDHDAPHRDGDRRERDDHRDHAHHDARPSRGDDHDRDDRDGRHRR